MPLLFRWLVVRIEIPCPSWPRAFNTLLHFSIFGGNYRPVSVVRRLCVIELIPTVLESIGWNTSVGLTPWSELLSLLMPPYRLVSSRNISLLKIIEISYLLWKWLIKNLIWWLQEYSSWLKDLLFVPHAKLNYLLDCLLGKTCAMLFKRVRILYHYFSYISEANITLSFNV
jgi:hypothetical protein